jgi:hypothetical protein
LEDNYVIVQKYDYIDDIVKIYQFGVSIILKNDYKLFVSDLTLYCVCDNTLYSFNLRTSNFKIYKVSINLHVFITNHKLYILHNKSSTIPSTLDPTYGTTGDLVSNGKKCTHIQISRNVSNILYTVRDNVLTWTNKINNQFWIDTKINMYSLCIKTNKKEVKNLILNDLFNLKYIKCKDNKINYGNKYKHHSIADLFITSDGVCLLIVFCYNNSMF